MKLALRMRYAANTGYACNDAALISCVERARRCVCQDARTSRRRAWSAWPADAFWQLFALSWNAGKSACVVVRVFTAAIRLCASAVLNAKILSLEQRVCIIVCPVCATRFASSAYIARSATLKAACTGRFAKAFRTISKTLSTGELDET